MTHGLRALRLLAVALTALLALGRGAAADDAGARFRDRFRAAAEKGVKIHARRIDVSPDGTRWTLSGDCRLETLDGGRIQVFSDGMVVWGRVASLSDAIDAIEVYAEGNVYLAAFSDTFEADALYLDMRAGEGRLERATLRTQGDSSGGMPFIARAERARVADGLSSFEGEHALLSTCTYHEPHFAFRADRIRIGRAIPDEARRVEEGVVETAAVDVDSPSLEAYDFPFLGWPGTLAWDTAWNRYIPSVTPGSTGRFGTFALIEVPLYPGRNFEAHGDLNLYERRGIGGGGGASWKGPARDTSTYKGFIDAFAIKDHADTDTSTREPVPDEDRLRIRGLHRDDLPLGFRREAEISYLSDRALLGEYFEAESKQGKEQETVLFGRWLHENLGATLQGRWRLNDFQTQTEYLPRARAFLLGEPFLDRYLPFGRGLYLSSALEVSNVRQRYDEETLLSSARIARFDFENRVDWPIPVGPIQVDPFAIGRYSAWSTGLEQDAFSSVDPQTDGRALDRWVWGGGAQATTDIWRDFGSFRHIMTPSTGIVNVFHVDTDPEALYPIDRMETARKTEFVPLGFRQRLQFWTPSVDRPADVIDWNVSTRVFLRPDRDNAGDRMGPLRSDLRVNPLPMIFGRWRSDWDLNREGGLFRSDAEVMYRPQRDWGLGVSHRFFEDTYRALGGSLDARLTEKWGARLSSQYDFEQGTFTNSRFTLVRYFHRFVLDVTIDADFGEDDVRFAVHFMPLELYGATTPLGSEVQRQQDPLF